MALRGIGRDARAVIAGMPGNDARWPAILRSHVTDEPAVSGAECVFAVDLSDVRLLADPVELCDLHRGALFVGSTLVDSTGCCGLATVR